jgi:DNA-binding MarR family transcriptional regulator
MSNDELIRLMQRVLSLYRRGIPSIEENGYHHGTGRILSKLVHQGDGISQAALAEKMNIRPQSMSEALTRLEEHGLIRRLPNPQDKRGTLVYLTDEGRFREAELAERRRQTADSLLCVLNESEKDTLATLLGKILAQDG